MRALLTIAVFLLPVIAFAEQNFVTRRDGFLLIWESIKRPAVETQYASFDDVPEGEEGHIEITWAKRRKILDDIDTFRPNDPLTYDDALLWIYRTRNIDDITEMTRETIPAMMERYPIVDESIDRSRRVESESELQRMIQILDGQLAQEVHEISFYADDFHGAGTAFGETFNMHELTAAHRTFPYNTLVKVTNIENGESVIVRINDRGPYHPGRDMDLSLAAFEVISHRGSGIGHATFERLGNVDLVSECEPEETQYQRRIVGKTHFVRGIPHDSIAGEQLVLQANRWFVVKGITFPDGVYIRMQDFVSPDEKFRFTPSEKGEHIFHIGTPDGRIREMRTNVSVCDIVEI